MSLRKLEALQYPQASTFNISDVKHFRTLVVWLEETKIRFYKIEQRQAIRQIQSPSWNEAFYAYLAALECPRPYGAQHTSADDTAVLLDWLLAQAVSAEYADHAAQYNSINKFDPNLHSSAAASASSSSPASSSSASGAAAGAASVSASSSVAIFDCSGDEFVKVLKRLGELLKLPVDEFKTEAEFAVLIQTVRNRLETHILPALREEKEHATASVSASASSSASSSSSSTSSGSGAKAAPQQQPPHNDRGRGFAVRSSKPPARTVLLDEKAALEELASTAHTLGFSTGDVQVDRAAAVLRLLYIDDLRELQTQVNEVIALTQEYTANPITDARLGQVGR